MKHKWLLLVVPLVVVFLAIEGFLLKLDLDHKSSDAGKIAGLPVMRISLHGTTLEEITSHSNDIKYEGNDLELSFDDTVLEFSDVQIKGRGNSTWTARKKPFQIKFKEKEDLFNFGARKKYILLANAYDDSFIRNALMFKMADILDEEYKMIGQSIELYIDNEYQGLYYLSTKVEIGKKAVDLRDKYGIIIEIDTLHRASEDCLEGEDRECLTIKEAVYEDDEEVVAEAAESFLKHFKRLLRVAKEGNFRKVSEEIDVESFAKYYLISEFAVNPDAYVSSLYFYRKDLNDKIHAGPIWDYDFAFGNKNWVWNTDDSFFSPTETMIKKKDVFTEEKADSDTGKLMYYLMDIPEFQAEVKRVFQEKMSGKKTEYLAWALQEAAKIKVAAERDAERWEKDRETFYRETKYLLNWLSERYDYFEKEYGQKECNLEWNFKPGVI